MRRIFGSAVLLAAGLGGTHAAIAAPTAREQRVEINVTGMGFEPATVQVEAGRPLVLVVTRKAERTCAQEIVIKDRKLRKTLPLNKAVEIRLEPQKAGTLRYACGMDMLTGKLVIE